MFTRLITPFLLELGIRFLARLWVGRCSVGARSSTGCGQVVARCVPRLLPGGDALSSGCC
eukprot:6502423-Lingulodinium_polyedra.AAC.1